MLLESVDVIIIGGGIAGLSASAALSQAGLSIVLIEGRDRLGGRIHTLKASTLPIPVDLGAEFIHGKPSQLWNIVRAKMLPVAEAAGDHICLEKSGLKRCNDYWDDWDRISRKMRLRGRKDETFQSFVDRLSQKRRDLSKARKRAIEYVEGFNAAHASEISLRSLIQDRDASKKIDGTRAFHLIHGYQDFLDYFETRLSKDVSTHLSTVVKEIQWSSGRVSVKAIDGASGQARQFEARTAVITLPLAVLQSAGQPGSIRFSPDIPAKIEAARALRMGKVVKAILVFRDPFWIERGLEKLSFLHTPGQPFPLFWTTAPVLTPILTGWASGAAAEAVAGKTQEQVLAAALHSLAASFAVPIRQLKSWLQEYFVADWQADPFALGAYSYAPSGSVGARQTLAKPIERTLFFAGEATHTRGFSGTVHGAIDTGNRAAAEVIAALRSVRRIA